MSDERYEIREKLGQGGVGVVYKALDTQLNREVAIKRVLADGGYESQDEATTQLLKEATALSSVQHPHIVTVYDAGVDNDGPYVVMELIHGKTLDEMVERGTLTWDDLREIALQSQEALIAAQDLDLVHRDLKPSNLMVCWLPSGKFQVKIVDFGLAKFSATPSLQTIDHGDAVFGSIFFMAPEQFERIPLDKCTDMYALGCLFYFALTGVYPFNGETAAAVMASHLQHHVTPLHELRPDIPQWGADWIMWHIERNMDDRPADARTALERFLLLDKQSTQPINLSAPGAQQPDPGAPKLIFPGNTPTPATQPVTEVTPSAQNVATAAQTVNTVNPQTAPQPIAPPQDGKVSPHTQVQQLSQTNTSLQTATIPAQPVTTTAPVTAPTPVTTPAPVASTATATTTEQADATTQEAPQPAITPKSKKSLPQGAKIAIIAVLLAVLLIIGFVGTSIMSDRKKIKRINAVMVEAKALDDQGTLRDGIHLTEDELKGILNRATSVEKNQQRPLVLKVLAYAKAEGGYDANSVIIDHVTTAKCSENIRKDIFTAVITRRKDVSNIEPLLAFAKSSSEGTAAAAAIDAARASATGAPANEFIDDFLSLIKDTDSSSIRNAAERAAAELINQAENKSQFTTPIVGAYETALNNDTKYTMLRLAGTAGGPEAAEVVRSAVASNDAALQNAAITALGQWADASEFETLTNFVDSTQDDKLRKRAFDAAYSFLIKPRPNKLRDINQLWESLSKIATTQYEKTKVINGMAQQKNKWALNILEPYLKDKDKEVAKKANQAKNYLKKNIK